jgi:valyl-tRNA synthetase
VARETPATCPRCHSTELEQDPDVLDTWFSSGLWPFSTLGWPDQTEDLKTFYPTSLLITGFDILFFWVSRMIMLGLELTGDVPFREVHIHGLVRDADKQKMSKSKGNVIDPLLIMDKFGTDAVRIALLISAAAGSDIAVKEDRLEAGRAFANKIWNASRLLFMNMERSGITSWTRGKVYSKTATEDGWIRDRLNVCTKSINESLKVHRYHDAGQAIWDFVWHDFCDWYLEIKKLRFRENSGQDDHWTEALSVYESALRLLHPFMPFISEELWQRLVASASFQHGISISLEPYPEPEERSIYEARAHDFSKLQQVVTAARELRADHKLDPKSMLDATLYLRTGSFAEQDLAAIGALAKIDIEQRTGGIPDHKGLIRSTPEFDLQLHTTAAAQNGASNPESRARILKEIATLERNIENSERQLGDPTFLSRAPEKVVLSLRAKVVEYQNQLAKNKKLLEGLE